MPLIGTSSEIICPKDLSKVDGLSRISLQNREGRDVIIASKGTLSDGLYSIWARCCPIQAREQRQVVLAAIKENLAERFGEQSAAIFGQKFSMTSRGKETVSIEPLKAKTLTVSELKDALESWKNTKTVTVAELSDKISDVVYDQEKFFEVLVEICGKQILDENSQPISLAEKDSLIKCLLKNFTITTKNPTAYALVFDYGFLLSETEKREEDPTPEQEQKLKQYSTSAQNILAADLERGKRIQAFSSSLKKSVEEYQDYAKAERAAGRIPNPRQDIKQPKLVSEPLLTPHARALLQSIAQGHL